MGWRDYQRILECYLYLGPLVEEVTSVYGLGSVVAQEAAIVWKKRANDLATRQQTLF